MNNSINNGKATVDKFRRSIELLKKQIVDEIKREQQYLKNYNKGKSDNDKKSMMNVIKQTRHIIESYRTALNDLTYAFLKHNRMAGLKIAKKFGYQTVEGYLADKENGIMPNLGTMIDLIANHYPFIPQFYKFDYSGPTKQIVRNYAILDKRNDYLIHSRTSGVRHIPSIPNYIVDEANSIKKGVESAARHR